MKNMKKFTALLISLIIILSCTQTAFAATYSISQGSPSQGRVFQLKTSNLRSVFQRISDIRTHEKTNDVDIITFRGLSREDRTAKIGHTIEYWIAKEYLSVCKKLASQACLHDATYSYTAQEGNSWNLSGRAPGKYAAGISFKVENARFYIYDYNISWSSIKVRVDEDFVLAFYETPTVELRKIG